MGVIQKCQATPTPSISENRTNLADTQLYSIFVSVPAGQPRIQFRSVQIVIHHRKIIHPAP
jgi:hypothetical protein